MTALGHLRRTRPSAARRSRCALVRHPGGGGKTGERRQPGRGAQIRPRLSQPREGGKHPRRLPLGGARLVRLVRPAQGPSPARLRREVAAFLAAGRDAGQAGNTLKLRAAAIRFLHRAAGLPSPTDTAEVSETMAGIRRDAPNPQKKRAATLAVLRELLAPIPDDVRGLRDRALLLVGFAGALRRSELAGDPARRPRDAPTRATS